MPMGTIKSQEPQNKRFAPVLFEVSHIHFQTGKEHNVIQAYFAEKLKTAITHQDIETMLPNDKPRQYHSDNVRNTKLIQQYGSKQYNEEYKEEYPCRVGDGKFQAEVKPIHRL